LSSAAEVLGTDPEQIARLPLPHRAQVSVIRTRIRI
jgi:hypothetical protein